MFIHEHDGGLAVAVENVVVEFIFAGGSPAGADDAILAERGKNAGVFAAADEVLRDDQVVGGMDEDAGTRATALAGRAGLGVADVPNEVVVNLVLLLGGLDVNGGADGEHIGKDIAGDNGS